MSLGPDSLLGGLLAVVLEGLFLFLPELFEFLPENSIGSIIPGWEFTQSA